MTRNEKDALLNVHKFYFRLNLINFIIILSFLWIYLKNISKSLKIYYKIVIQK